MVIGWDKDDLTDEEFWFFVRAIKDLGRLEEWTPPDEWVRRLGGRPMGNRYLTSENTPTGHASTRGDVEPRERLSAGGESDQAGGEAMSRSDAT